MAARLRFSRRRAGEAAVHAGARVYVREGGRLARQAFLASMGEDGGPESRKFSEAKGGGFFFFSQDKQYMVKTMTKGEHRDMLKILPAYCRHMREQPRSLIARVSGVYSIAMYEQQVYFMVMDFLFWERVCPKIHMKFDLKVDQVSILQEYREQVPLEFDFEREAESLTRIDKAIHRDRGCPHVVLPGLKDRLCSRRVLTMHFLDGQNWYLVGGGIGVLESMIDEIDSAVS